MITPQIKTNYFTLYHARVGVTYQLSCEDIFESVAIAFRRDYTFDGQEKCTNNV